MATQKNGYEIKVQKVERPTNRSYYINLPVALAEAISVKKGEAFLWHVEDKNTLIFQRAKPVMKKKIKALG